MRMLKERVFFNQITFLSLYLSAFSIRINIIVTISKSIITITITTLVGVAVSNNFYYLSCGPGILVSVGIHFFLRSHYIFSYFHRNFFN